VGDGGGGATKKKRASSASDHQRITERDKIPKLWDCEKASKSGSYTFKIAYWNVAGLRALLNRQSDALRNIPKQHDLDMLCLQETKLQEAHLEDRKKTKVPTTRDMMREDGYSEHWSFSTKRKGYSWMAIFVRKRGKKRAGSKQSSISSFFAPKKSVKSKKTEEDDGRADTQSSATTEPSQVSSDMLTPTNVSYGIGKVDGQTQRNSTLSSAGGNFRRRLL